MANGKIAQSVTDEPPMIDVFGKAAEKRIVDTMNSGNVSAAFRDLTLCSWRMAALTVVGAALTLDNVFRQLSGQPYASWPMIGVAAAFTGLALWRLDRTADAKIRLKNNEPNSLSNGFKAVAVSDLTYTVPLAVSGARSSFTELSAAQPNWLFGAAMMAGAVVFTVSSLNKLATRAAATRVANWLATAKA